MAEEIKPARKILSEGVKRLQVELSEERMAAFDALIQEGDLKTRKDVFDYAMTLLHWAVQEARLGRDIASVDREHRELAIIKTPMLEHIKLGISRGHKSKEEKFSVFDVSS